MTNDHQQPVIQLSDPSIQDLISLCQTIERKNAKNEISVNMAKGIADYLGANGTVTARQAIWLARNADFHKIKRPAELADVVVEKKEKNSPAPPAASPEPIVQDDFPSKVIGSLHRIEKLLERSRT